MLNQIFENAVYDVRMLEPTNKNAAHHDKGDKKHAFDDVSEITREQAVVNEVTDDNVICSDGRIYDLLDFMEIAMFVSPALDDVTDVAPIETKQLPKPNNIEHTPKEKIIDDSETVDFNEAKKRNVITDKQLKRLQELEHLASKQEKQVEIEAEHHNTERLASPVINGVLKKAKTELLKCQENDCFSNKLLDVIKALNTLDYTTDEVLNELRNHKDLTDKILGLWIKSLLDIENHNKKHK